ncbi:hypothetical protein BDV93DRAFT_524369 [Ceratobasidium sp. AG-I]|nr:hypothetical protein BDV93DRAFT_524369 [Ceratobasidium sp. AG-I]
MPTGAPQVPEPRLRDIFPPGVSSASLRARHTGSHYTLKLEQLYYSLVERYDSNTHADSIIVKSAWYSKQTRAAEREFILIQVEDVGIEGLSNYLVLDRNTGEPSQRPLGMMSRALVFSQAPMTVDAFRVSYDGNMKQLLEECQLNPYKCVERIQFDSEMPLRLYELVALTCVISDRYPLHRAVDSGLNLFVGLVWECIRQMRPAASHNISQPKKRGIFARARSAPSSAQIEEAYGSVQEKLDLVELELKTRRLQAGATRKSYQNESNCSVVALEGEERN